MAASMCFTCSCTLQLYDNLEFLLAKRIVMAAWMLHGLRFGRKPGQETLCFSFYNGYSRRWKVPLVRVGCGLGSAKARISPHCKGCFDVFLPIIWNLSLQNVLWWLHAYFINFILGESRIRKPAIKRDLEFLLAKWIIMVAFLEKAVVFPCKVASASDESILCTRRIQGEFGLGLK